MRYELKKEELNRDFFNKFYEFLMSIAKFLVQLIGTAVLSDDSEWICAEVLVDIEKCDGLHERTQDDLLVVREVELKDFHD